MPHARLGETVCAVVTVDGAAPVRLAEVAAFMKAEGIAAQKFPEHLEILDELPKTASGKVRKDVLREMIAEKVRRGEIAA
jgi:non-ribosomal peptide synthetase component E (peptide arylation enzyme)